MQAFIAGYPRVVVDPCCVAAKFSKRTVPGFGYFAESDEVDNASTRWESQVG